MKEISATEAARLLEEDPEGTVLLDVREPEELEAAAVGGARHIPMGQVPERLDEIDRDKRIICMCKLGGRSAQVARYLEQQGCRSVANLEGGIDAWARDVDPGVVRDD